MGTEEVLRRLFEARWRRVWIGRTDHDRPVLVMAFGGDGDLSMTLRVPLSDLDVQRLRQDLADGRGQSR